VSLGTFGTTEAVRSKIQELISNGKWLDDRVLVPVHSVALYKRDSLGDNKFYAVASVPLMGHHTSGNVEYALSDAGASLSAQMRGTSIPVLMELERACEAALADYHGQLKATILPYGSYAMNTSLPVISDVDAVVQVSPCTSVGNASSSLETLRAFNRHHFLQRVALRIESVYPTSKLRVRLANARDVAVHVLTTKLWPDAPSVDLLVCTKDADGSPVDAMSASAQEALDDTIGIMDAIRTVVPRLSEELNALEAIEGALRLIKLWANRRQIYGAKLGFLGGGGWAVLFARVLADLEDENEKLALLECKSVPEASKQLVKAFFVAASGYLKEPKIVALPGSEALPGIEKTAEKLVQHQNLAVIAPISGGNFARNSTKSTAAAMINEIARAASCLSCDDDISQGMHLALHPFDLRQRFGAASSFLVLHARIPDLTKHGVPLPADVKAWACRNFLNTLVSLERECMPNEIRLLSRPKKVEDNFVFVMLVPITLSNDFVRKKNHQLQLEFKESFSAYTEENDAVSLQCLSAHDAAKIYE